MNSHELQFICEGIGEVPSFTQVPIALNHNSKSSVDLDDSSYLLQHKCQHTYKHEVQVQTVVQTNSLLFQCQFISVHNFPFDCCLFILI